MSAATVGLQRLARTYADAVRELEEVVDEVRGEQRRIARERLRSIQSRAAKASAAKDALRDAVGANHDLFVRPRTQAAHGVKFGLRKKPGRIEGDAKAAVARIDETMPERAADLVRTRRELVKPALAGLSARDLAALGLALADAGDEVVVQAASGEIDRLVDALLSDAAAEEGR